MLSGAFTTVVGRVNDAPRINDGGKSKMATFRIGVIEKGKEGEATWSNFDVVVFGRMAEIVEQYVEKGSEVMVSGPQRQREYTDGQGNKRTSAQITANDLKLGARPQGQGGGDGKAEGQKTEAKSSKPSAKAADDFPDDVPF